MENDWTHKTEIAKKHFKALLATLLVEDQISPYVVVDVTGLANARVEALLEVEKDGVLSPNPDVTLHQDYSEKHVRYLKYIRNLFETGKIDSASWTLLQKTVSDWETFQVNDFRSKLPKEETRKVVVAPNPYLGRDTSDLSRELDSRMRDIHGHTSFNQAHIRKVYPELVMDITKAQGLIQELTRRLANLLGFVEANKPEGTTYAQPKFGENR